MEIVLQNLKNWPMKYEQLYWKKNDVGPYLVYNIFVTHLLNCSNLHKEQKEKKTPLPSNSFTFFYPADKVYI